jgi:hypothetical protein
MNTVKELKLLRRDMNKYFEPKSVFYFIIPINQKLI